MQRILLRRVLQNKDSFSSRDFSISLAHLTGVPIDIKNLTQSSKLEIPSHSLPSDAQIVICGGGAQGAAIAFKLAQQGYGEQTVLIEQGNLGGGSTWHSSGLIGHLRSSPVESKLCKLSRDLYMELERLGYYTGWKECGSINLARKKDRLAAFRKIKSSSVSRNIECHIVTPDWIKEKCPLLRVDDLEGGLWVPQDGIANTLEICLSLCHLSAKGGVKIVQNCTIESIVAQRNGSLFLETDQGSIKCEKFVNTAGFWARNVGLLSKPRVNVPTSPTEHYYLTTKPVSDLPFNHPVVKDLDGGVYVRENDGRYLAGGFEPWAKPAFQDGTPESNATRELPVDWDHFHTLLENLLHRIPSMGEAHLEKLINEPEAFSPDGEWIIGQAPEIKNYFVVGGMTSAGVGAAGGVGTVIADYILNGAPTFDMYNLDVQRFLGMHNNAKFLRDRVREVPGILYSINYPFREFKTGRSMRTSPIFPKMRAAGARFNQVMGYERAMYFQKEVVEERNSFLGLDSLYKGGGSSSGYKSNGQKDSEINLSKTETFFKPQWFDSVQKEFIASREKVSVCDYSSFAKYDLWSSGTEVVDFLQHMCSNDVDVPIGTIVHTGMQNEKGGYENDCSLARLSKNRYMLMSPSVQQMKSYTWMKYHLPSNVILQDVTSLYTALCIMGPHSRALLSKLTLENLESLDQKSFPFFTCRYMNVGCAPNILTMNLTHTGELGYVMYIPNEFAVHVYDTILSEGDEFGISQCGYYAMRALRIEKFFAFWGQDLDSHSTPLECGRAFRVKSNGDFIGKEALLRQKEEGLTKLLVMLLLDPLEHDTNVDPWPWGEEPIYRNGKFVGTVTTSSFGFSLKRHVVLGFLHHDDGKSLVTQQWIREGNYEIDIAGHLFPAHVKLNPPVLPTKVEGIYTYTPTRHSGS
ncbi:pyruvate dehydrogenase phosphatase regulatory subunit, mitochondrial [Lepeophtheirus salmonis]|uniref:pyruvate dehydrogenase phosphatase regulatory subunit, mitochondrial n=1 Tax=Lepeophtheirus salmonis TaxID=72036 RepID=UPI001AE7D4E3|nr:pyruvate dehydrogenase phosphatase regulatory subunit, mitochondrial-like [Lepeophtheirus salmonis]